MDLSNEVVAIKNSNLQRVYIEACLLATNDLEAIAALMEMPVEIIHEYEREVFSKGRETRLSKLEYVDAITDAKLHM